MSRILSVLAGTTALVSLSSVAFAADMDPVRAAAAPAPIVAAAFEPPPPVVNCKDKKGYYVVPNSNTCLKINGMIRAQVYLHENNIASDHWTGDEYGNVSESSQPNSDTWTMGTAARFGADTSTETDYGTLRGNILLQADAAANGSAGPAGIRLAFIEWNGFTIGHTNSFFAPDGALGGLGGDIGDYDTRLTLFGYTASFTKEISASVSIEDHDARDGDETKANGLYLSPTPVKNEGVVVPDLVANVVGKFDWGQLFASGALSNNQFNAPAVGYHDNQVGYALGLGGNFNLDALAKGDAVQAKLGFADGAGGYIGSSDDNAIIDTVSPTYGAQLTSGWSAQGSFLHNWSPTWNTVYMVVTYRPRVIQMCKR